MQPSLVLGLVPRVLFDPNHVFRRLRCPGRLLRSVQFRGTSRIVQINFILLFCAAVELLQLLEDESESCRVRESAVPKGPSRRSRANRPAKVAEKKSLSNVEREEIGLAPRVSRITASADSSDHGSGSRTGRNASVSRVTWSRQQPASTCSQQQRRHAKHRQLLRVDWTPRIISCSSRSSRSRNPRSTTSSSSSS